MLCRIQIPLIIQELSVVVSSKMREDHLLLDLVVYLLNKMCMFLLRFTVLEIFLKFLLPITNYFLIITKLV